MDENESEDNVQVASDGRAVIPTKKMTLESPPKKKEKVPVQTLPSERRSDDVDEYDESGDDYAYVGRAAVPTKKKKETCEPPSPPNREKVTGEKPLSSERSNDDVDADADDSNTPESDDGSFAVKSSNEASMTEQKESVMTNTFVSPKKKEEGPVKKQVGYTEEDDVNSYISEDTEIAAEEEERAQEEKEKNEEEEDAAIDLWTDDVDEVRPKKKQKRDKNRKTTPKKKLDNITGADLVSPPSSQSKKKKEHPESIRKLNSAKSKPLPTGLTFPPPGYCRALRYVPLAETYNELRSAHEEKERTLDEKDLAFKEYERAKRLYEEATQRDVDCDKRIQSATKSYYYAELADPGCPWNKMYEKLRTYHEENGHCNIKTAKSGLGVWVQAQRRLYKTSKLSPWRIDALNRINFIWDSHGEKWASRIRELIAYKDATGTTDIPYKYPPNQQFAHWVHEQRGQYKWLAEGKPSVMTREKIRELDALGFIWKSDFPRTKRKGITNDPPPKTEEEIWDMHYEQLRECYEQYGHSRIYSTEQKPPPGLLRWMSWQRKQYQLREDGEPNQLTEERLEKLDKIEFVWKTANLSKI